MELDEDGILKVKAEEKDANNKKEIIIQDVLNLTNQEIEKFKQIEYQFQYNSQINENNNKIQKLINCIYDIKKGKNDKNDYLNNPIRILNCYEEAKKDHPNWNLEGINNEKEIKENCELYLNENKIDFCYKYKFGNEGKYTIEFIKYELYVL